MHIFIDIIYTYMYIYVYITCAHADADAQTCACDIHAYVRHRMHGILLSVRGLYAFVYKI